VEECEDDDDDDAFSTGAIMLVALPLVSGTCAAFAVSGALALVLVLVLVLEVMLRAEIASVGTAEARCEGDAFKFVLAEFASAKFASAKFNDNDRGREGEADREGGVLVLPCGIPVFPTETL
jgi:hypothetical protein